MNAPSLILEGYGVAFGDRVILADVDLCIPTRGIQVITGPGGSGKSTLVRSICGCNDAQPSFRTWGKTRYGEAAELGENRPTLVGQNARLLISSIFENLASALPNRQLLAVAEQKEVIAQAITQAHLGNILTNLHHDVLSLEFGARRQLAILRAVLANPALLCVDEATSELDEHWSKRILSYLRTLAEERAVLFITHNRQHALLLGGKTALMAGGRLIENRSTDSFYSAPIEELSRNFVRFGSCSAPNLNANPEELTPEAQKLLPRVLHQPRIESGAQPASAFRWLIKGRLAGTSRPGLLRNLDEDLRGLAAVGIGVLVTLEERLTVDVSLTESFALHAAFFPIPDMGAPTCQAAFRFCQEISQWLGQGLAVALHCRAGLGRTGTMLAAYLIYDGRTAIEALERARTINPGWVQSEEQLHFLEAFSLYVAAQANAA
jgi:atypical dual specificity phosphatase